MERPPQRSNGHAPARNGTQGHAPNPNGAQPGKPPVLVNGTVLRGLSIGEQPTLLRRPAPGGVRPAARAEPVTPGQLGRPGDDPGSERAYRAGFADGEAAQRAAQEASLEGSRRAAVEQALEDGTRRGLEEGREAGRAEVQREAAAGRDAVAARLRQLDAILDALAPALGERLGAADEDMIALCHEVVCKILGDALQGPEGVGALVRQAIQAATAGAQRIGQLAIHVHPRDLAALEADPALAAWVRQRGTGGGVRWVGDEGVVAGGCVIQSAEGSLDARLETQWRALRHLLAGRTPASKGAR